MPNKQIFTENPENDLWHPKVNNYEKERRTTPNFIGSR